MMDPEVGPRRRVYRPAKMLCAEGLGLTQQLFAAAPAALPVKGAPNGVVTPLIEGTPVPNPIGEHGAVVADVESGSDGLEGVVATRGVSVMRFANGFGARATDGGLRPATPTSVDPIGIPTLPTGDPAAILVGDEVDGISANGVLALPAQVPDPGPDVPPPSNKLEALTVDIPESEEFPGIEVPMPEDACGSEPPTSEQVAMPPIAGNMPEIVGPGDASSVAPIGIPDGPTGEPGPRPSGDVMPSGGPGEMLIPSTCA
jgi:hypothetical protein